MLELFQTEWCPASRRVRQRMTELGLDYINRQVPVERDQRTTLLCETGADTIPVLRLEDRSIVIGEQAILAALDRLFAEPPEAAEQRDKAATARRRALERDCPCLEAAAGADRVAATRDAA